MRYQLGSEQRQLVQVDRRNAIGREGAPVNPAEFRQALMKTPPNATEAGQNAQALRRHVALRTRGFNACGERPRCRHSADKRDELAPSHLTPPRTRLVQCLEPSTLRPRGE